MLLIKNLIGWLSGKFLGNNTLATGFILALIIAVLAIIIPNISNISEKLGFETKESLKVSNEVKKQQINQLSETNKDLAKTVESNEKISENKIEAVVDQQKHETKVDKVVTDIQLKVDKKITAIKKNPKIEKKTDEIAKENIAALWETFCSLNDDAQCQPTGT